MDKDDLKEILKSQDFVDHQKKDKHKDHQWMMCMENDDDDDDDVTSTSESSSINEDYSRTSSSSDLVDDASSNSNGPLYELSEVMAQLPIKRGLSKYFEGKSRPFTCLSSVRNIQEFAKKGTRYKKKKKMKMKKGCKSYGGTGLMMDTHKLYTVLPRPTISKKLSRNSNSMSAATAASLCFAGKTSCRPPLFPVQNNNFSSV